MTELEKSKAIIQYIADAKKATPVELYTDEDIKNAYSCKVIGKDGLRVVFGDWEEIEKASIGDRAVIMMGAVINIGAEIGEGTMIDMNVVLGGRAKVGKNCHIGAGAVLAGVIEPPSADPVVIEDDVVVGANAVVLEGVRVGKGSVVAAGAIVTENVPEGVVVAGTPAKIIKGVDAKTASKTELVDALRNI